MKSQFVALAIVLAGLPALAWGQASCGCTSRVPLRSTPASYGAWADYQPAGYQDGSGCGGCGGCAPACCDPCCRPLLCIIPNTIRKIGCALDCLLPCGPRSCGVGCNSGVSCSGGCPSCGGPAVMGNPFQDDEPLPMPMPPKPKMQETRRQPSIRAPREYAAAPSASDKTASTRPATRSVLTRAPQPVEEEVSRADHMDSPAKKPVSMIKRTSATAPVSTSTTQSSRRSTDIPHNPLR